LSSWPLLVRHGTLGVNILTADQLDIVERFTGKGGLKGADRFTGAAWTTGSSGVPLLVGALAAADCEVGSIIERHSHGIAIRRVLDLIVSSRTAALAYWQGQYVAIDKDEDAVRLAECAADLICRKLRTDRLDHNSRTNGLCAIISKLLRN
jgi:flavin reductase (DIM6/NTAB) family NADH-FMN oxidoreductase RutF